MLKVTGILTNKGLNSIKAAKSAFRLLIHQLPSAIPDIDTLGTIQHPQHCYQASLARNIHSKHMRRVLDKVHVLLDLVKERGMRSIANGFMGNFVSEDQLAHYDFFATLPDGQALREQFSKLANKYISAASNLTTKQQDFMRTFADSPTGISILVGRAGSGKNVVLAHVILILKELGLKIIAASTNHGAAKNLHSTVKDLYEELKDKPGFEELANDASIIASDYPRGRQALVDAEVNRNILVTTIGNLIVDKRYKQFAESPKCYVFLCDGANQVKEYDLVAAALCAASWESPPAKIKPPKLIVLAGDPSGGRPQLISAKYNEFEQIVKESAIHRLIGSGHGFTSLDN